MLREAHVFRYVRVGELGYISSRNIVYMNKIVKENIEILQK